MENSKKPFNILSTHHSLIKDYLEGKLTLEQVAEEFYIAGFTHFIDLEYTKVELSLDGVIIFDTEEMLEDFCIDLSAEGFEDQHYQKINNNDLEIKINHQVYQKVYPLLEQYSYTLLHKLNPSIKIQFQIISPDGFATTREPIECRAVERDSAIQKEIERFTSNYQRQGYYSSNNGRIALSELAKYCQVEYLKDGD